MKYWIDNEIDGNDDYELPKPHDRPISYIKIPICWSLYYLKHNFSFNDAMKDIILKGGDTQANAAIVGGLLGASHGLKDFKKKDIKTVLTVKNDSDSRLREYQPGSAISVEEKSLCKIQNIIKNAPTDLIV